VNEARNVGTVVSVTDGICRIHGLADVRYGEMVEFRGTCSPGAEPGAGLRRLRRAGRTTSRSPRAPRQDHRPHPRGALGRELLGRVVDALGIPIDGKGPVHAKATAPIERVAPGVIYRQSVGQPVQTGYKAVDAMVPIGRASAELIIGDRQTGKTALAVDTIINQKTLRH